jgi:hypothetical protein
MLSGPPNRGKMCLSNTNALLTFYCTNYGLQICQNIFIYIIKFNPIYMILKSNEIYSSKESRSSVVGIATDYGLDVWGVRVPVGPKIVSSQRRPDRHWGPPSLLSNWYRVGSLPGCKATGTWSWPLTSNYCRDQESVDLYIHSPIRLPGVV